MSRLNGLLAAFSKTGSATIATAILSIVSRKILATIVGPSGLGLYSILRQTRELATVAGSFSGRTAIVQGLASIEGSKRSSYLVTSFWVFVIGGLIVTFALVWMAPWISMLVLPQVDAQSVTLIRLLALPTLLAIALAYLSGLLNGYRAIGRLAIVGVINALTIAVLAYPIGKMVSEGHPVAFILLMSCAQFASVVFAFFVVFRAGWIKVIFRDRNAGTSREHLRHFFSISGTTVITGIVSASSLLGVRALITADSGLSAAGNFDAAWTLSMTYMQLILTSLGTYYMPTLAGEKDPEQKVILIRQVLIFVTVLGAPMITVVILLKPLVIDVLYSKDFVDSLEVIRWMLIGDYLKATSWCFGITILAYADMKTFFWTQNFVWLWFLGFTYSSLSVFHDIQWVGMGFVSMYFLYLLFLVYYVRRKHGFRWGKRAIFTWAGGLTLVLGSSWATWLDKEINWWVFAIWISVVIAFSWFAITRHERKNLLELIRLDRKR